NNTIAFNTWQYVVVTWDGTGLTTGIHMYINGTEAPYNTKAINSSTTLDASEATADLVIGNRFDANRKFNGTIDEFRFSQAIRTPQWIQTEYNNQKSGSTMTTLGSEQSNAIWYSTGWQFRKNITIDQSQVNGTLANFPLLVQVPRDVDLASKMQSNANDLF